MMTRRDFEAIAYAIATAGGDLDRTVRNIADACYASNGRFDRERFYRLAKRQREAPGG